MANVGAADIEGMKAAEMEHLEAHWGKIRANRAHLLKIAHSSKSLASGTDGQPSRGPLQCFVASILVLPAI